PALEIVTTPPGAQVLLGGVLLTGETPLRLEDVAIGTRYELKIVRDGFRPESVSAQVTAPGVRTVQVPLVQAATSEEAKAPAKSTSSRTEAKSDKRAAKPVERAADKAQADKPQADKGTVAVEQRTVAAPSGSGMLRIVVRPWGVVNIDGR